MKRRTPFALAALLMACGSSPGSPAAEPAAPAPAAAPPKHAPAEPAATSAKPQAAPAPEAKPAASGPAKPLNVLLILVDSMRADMPWAGYERPIAPNLSKLESQSVSYTRGYSVSSYTAKSVAAVLSGQYPSTLKRSGYFFTKYPESNLFFPELLDAAGVKTFGVHGHMYMKRGNGMDQGFTRWEVVEGITFDNTTDRYVTSQKMTPLAIDMLKSVTPGERFFMYAHYMDPHDQYVAHEEAPDWGKHRRDLYDQEIFYTDLWIGKLLEYAKQQPWWESTAVIVSADHGEAFGEHKMYRHAFELWEPLTHVPLFFHLPGVAARHVDVPRSGIDLAPTILELMGVDGSPKFHGKSLVKELYGGEEPALRPILLDLPADSNNPERRALVVGDYKLLVYGNDWRFDLFDLKNDPGEAQNLAKKQPDKLAELKQLYEKLMSGLERVKPYGGNKLMGGGRATGPSE